MRLLRSTSKGLYCEAGDFYVDPSQGVEFAVITHAHSDHARRGSRVYLSCDTGRSVLAERIGRNAHIETLAYGQSVMRNGVRISLHPAGHILGSSQVRLEYQGEIWVVTGDYKIQPDPTCTPFEPVRCHTLITECTFGLPVYQWEPSDKVIDDIRQWWILNQRDGYASVVFAYSLGKAQRLLVHLGSDIGPIYVYPSIAAFCPLYEAAGIHLPPFRTDSPASGEGAGALVITPQSAMDSDWFKAFGPTRTAFASGWMLLRKARRNRTFDRGFALSDHADWPELLQTIAATGAEEVLATHGFTGPLVRWLQEHGYRAAAIDGPRQRSETEEIPNENDAST